MIDTTDKNMQWEQLNTYNYYNYLCNIERLRGKFNIPNGEYYEIHHIIPRAFGGEPEKLKRNTTHDNLIWLTLSEHFEAHKILAEDNLQNYKAVYAYMMMSNRQKIKTGEEYEKIRKAFIDFDKQIHVGKPSPNKGKIYTAEERKKISELTKKAMQNPETKKKISESGKGRKPWNLGIPMSDEMKRRQSQQKKGKPISEEHKKHISEGMMGRIVSEETRKKISEAQRGEKCVHNKKIICIETGEVFFNIKDASQKLNINASNIVQVCKGKYKTAGKLHFKYVKENTDE